MDGQQQARGGRRIGEPGSPPGPQRADASAGAAAGPQDRGVRVLKFGGAALRDAQAIRRAAELVRRCGGPRPVVVVSAVGDVTRRLEAALERARAGELAWDELRVRHRSLLSALGLRGDLLDRHLFDLRGLLAAVAAGRADGRRADPPDGRRLSDQVLSFGERMSARIVAAALGAEGLRGVPIDAYDAGLLTEERGRPVAPAAAAARVRRALALESGVPVVTGFVGVDRAGQVTTLGRNGSDLSAVWIGAALGAEEVQLWKEVAGIQRADPRLVPGAATLAQVGRREATLLARHGAGVLHPEALAPLAPLADHAGPAVWLRDVRAPEASGTRIVERSAFAGPLAVASRGGLTLFELDARGPAAGAAWRGTRAGELATLLEALAREGAELVACQAGAAHLRALCARAPRRAPLAPLTTDALRTTEGLGTVSVVGRELGEGSDVGARLLGVARALDPLARPWSDASCASVVLDESHLPELVRRAHAAFFEREELQSPRAG